MVIIYSVIPSLRNELGHFYEYHLALSKAAKINNYEHIKIISKIAKIPSTDNTWKKLLFEINYKKKWKNFKNIFPLIFVFKKIKKYKKGIIFLEDFNLIILLLILIAAIFVRPEIELWLFHRFEYEKTFSKGKAYKLIHFLLEKIFNKKKVKYLTDSELIKKINENFFKRTFHVFPIPHVYFYEEKKNIEKQLRHFWWPGGLIREEKGLKHIKKLTKILKESDNINIIMADSAKNLMSNKNAIFVPTNLCRKKYEDLMINSDLILLPYISDLYRYRTSGIFVEAVVSGSIPVVSKNTWMAYELLKFDLQELVMDWESPKIIEELKNICDSINFKEKLKIMKDNYKKKHSVENYALVMRSLLD